MSEQELKSALMQKSQEEGFGAIGITKAELPEQNKLGFKNFLASGWQGDMQWMIEKQARRLAPENLWPEANSIIMLAMNYGPESNPLPELENTQNGVISCYAKGKDYHDIVKKKLKNIARWLVAETGSEVKVFVDTAPVMEKPLAMQAGLGWQGKHTNLVSKELGSWTFLGAIFTTHNFTPVEPEIDHCGSCQKCLDICPTKAFPQPYKLDARRCISYLTIEHKGPIPRDLRKSLGNRIYGCDDCLAICPWNKFAKIASETRFLAREEIDNPPLKDLLQLDDQAFRLKFAGTPIKRTGRTRFIRNCLMATGNSNDQSLLPDVIKHLSDEEALVRSAAVWALSQLANAETFATMKSSYIINETDQIVLDEWQLSG